MLLLLGLVTHYRSSWFSSHSKTVISFKVSSTLSHESIIFHVLIAVHIIVTNMYIHASKFLSQVKLCFIQLITAHCVMSSKVWCMVITWWQELSRNYTAAVLACSNTGIKKIMDVKVPVQDALRGRYDRYTYILSLWVSTKTLQDWPTNCMWLA